LHSSRLEKKKPGHAITQSYRRYDPKNKAGEVSNFYYVKQEDEDALTAVLAIKGPVAIAINAGLRSFQFYSSEFREIVLYATRNT
jgi:hypothetical protein